MASLAAEENGRYSWPLSETRRAAYKVSRKDRHVLFVSGPNSGGPCGHFLPAIPEICHPTLSLYAPTTCIHRMDQDEPAILHMQLTHCCNRTPRQSR